MRSWTPVLDNNVNVYVIYLWFKYKELDSQIPLGVVPHKNRFMYVF